MSVKFVSIRKIEGSNEDYAAEFLLNSKRILVDLVKLRETVIDPATDIARKNLERLRELLRTSPDAFVESDFLTVDQEVFLAVQSALSNIIYELHNIMMENNSLSYRYKWSAGELTRTV